MFLSIVFCWVPGLILHRFRWYFYIIVWHVFAIVRTSGFNDFVLVFHRSRGITFNTFCACFFDFISSVIFDMIFSTFEAISVSVLRQKTIKNSSWKSLVFWLRKKSHRNCFLHFWTLFGIIFGRLLLDFRVPFFIVFYGGGEAFRHRLVPFWIYFGVIFVFFCCFFECNLNLFDTGHILETKARK